MLAAEKMMREEESEVGGGEVGGGKLDGGNVKGLLMLVGYEVKEMDTNLL